MMGPLRLIAPGAMRRTLVLIAVALPIARAAAQDAKPDTLSVDGAVALALENDQRVTYTRLEVERAQSRVAAARTQRLPQFSLEVQAAQLVTPIHMTFPAGSFGEVDPYGPVPAEETELESSTDLVVTMSGQVAQPITQLLRIGLGIKKSELSHSYEQAKLREQSLAVATEARSLYHAIVTAERAVDAAALELGAIQELKRNADDEVAREVALPASAIELDARRAAQEATLVQLRGDLARYRESLNLLTGRPLDQPFTLVDPGDPTTPLPELADAEAEALRRRPDLAQAQLRVGMAEIDKRSKKSEYIPDVSVALSYQSYFNVELLPRDITQVGVQLKWEPFDWGRKKQELASTNHALRQAQDALSTARDHALIEVRDHYRKVEQAQAMVEARRLAKEAAEEKARVMANRKSVEMSLPGEALEVESAAAEANVQYQQALQALWTARAELEEVLGAGW